MRDMLETVNIWCKMNLLIRKWRESLPHVVLEYSANVQLPVSPRDFLKAFNAHLGAYKTFELERIKSRACCLEPYCMGDGAEGKGFVYLNCAIVPGRSESLRLGLQERLLKFLEAKIVPCNLGMRLHFSVHLVELKQYQFKYTHAN